MDLVGEKFGRLTVIGFEGVKDRKSRWKCVCECGLTVVVSGNNLRSGNTKSCGCMKRDAAAATGKANRRHGESREHRTRLYTIWCGMRQRCNNPNRNAYPLYGGKGVKTCEAWDEYPAFKAWALAHGYTDELCIDRIDPSKGYSPENCRWITASENTARANKNHTTRKVIRGEGVSKVRQPQRIDGEKI